MYHGPWSLTSITILKMLGGYRGLTSRIFLDFNWITSIIKFEMLGGYRSIKIPKCWEVIA